MSAWQNDGNEITGKVLAVAGVMAVLALIIGFAIGMFLGRSSAPDLAVLAGQAHDSAAALQQRLAPAKAKYDASVADGTITNPTAYTDAQGRIAAVKAGLAQQHVMFEALAPGAYDRAVAAVAALQKASSTPVAPTEFDTAFAAADGALAVLAGR